MEPEPISEKEKIIASVFYDKRRGFGSLNNTFLAAKEHDPTITRSDVRYFLSKQEVRQRKKPNKKELNNFLPDMAHDEFQVDLADFGERSNPRYGFVCLDIFTKKAVLIPLKSKTAPETSEALNHAFQTLGFPDYIMCDEGGEFHGEFSHDAKEQGVDIVYSRTGGRFVERLIRTLKKGLFERRNTFGGNWSQHAQDVIDKYNDSIHNSTLSKPDTLGKPENEYDWVMQKRAYKNMQKKVEFPNRRGALEVGDRVKLRVKPKGLGSYKETHSSWSQEVYTVTKVEPFQNQGSLYHLEGYRKPLLRYEVMKVDDVQRSVAGQLKSVLHDVQHPRPAHSAANAETVPIPARIPAPIFRPGTRSTPASVHIPSPGGSSNSRGPAMPPPALPPPVHVVPVVVRTTLTPAAARAALVIRRPATRAQVIASPPPPAAIASDDLTIRRPMTRSQTQKR